MQKVLVIDDEKPTLSMFQLFLKAYGYSVYTAESGEKGLEIFEQEKPPLVISDIKMPGMDGIQVLGRIKEMSPHTEVIIITGHGDADLTIRAMELNATDFLHKPIEKNALQNALKRAVERLGILESSEEQIALSSINGTAIVDIQGNINASHEKRLQEIYQEINEQGKTGVLFRFNPNSSVNGTGIAVFIQILSMCRDNGQKAVITGLSENFQKFFHLVGITRMAEIYEAEDQALSRLQEQAG